MTFTVSFEGKVAVVTGGARGIGEAAARAFAEAGANVMIADILPNVEETASRLAKKYGVDVRSCIVDVTDADACHSMVDQTVSAFGKLDFAFNNAGIGGVPNDIHETPVADWRKVIDVNLHSVFNCLHAEIPAMLKNGGGAIVNTSSVCGERAIAKYSHYVAAKHGIVALTKQTAIEYAERGIRCNAVGPGFVDTDMMRESGEINPDHRALLAARIPMGRLGVPDDIGKVVRTLCSDECGYITGAFLPVDGGMLQI